ncbi:MAG: hypothetical protein HY782_20850 [Chloroflexi bacterium]|nr:hypothetical protein [Chloroflexota bacterium]
MSSRHEWLPTRLAILLVAFVALALFYSLIIPLFEGPDEDDHFRFAKFIADTRALPVQLFKPGGGVAGHQGWQPPLYYTLAALVISPLDTSDFAQHLWRNYAATFVGDPACCGRNIYYHTDSENFPFTRTTLAVHLARLLSILFGAVTVWATYNLATEVAATQTQSRPAPTIPESAKADFVYLLQRFSQRDALAQSPDLLPLAAAALVAFNPSFLFASALVSNDAALAAFSSLILLVWVKLIRGALALNLRSAMLLGALIGFAVLTKTTALGLVPLSVLLLLFLAWRRRDLRIAITGNAMMLATIALLAGWWFVRNLWLYGDPLALRLVEVSALFPRAGPLTLPELFQISLPWMWQTFWGGPTPGDFSPIILVGLAMLSGLAVIGMIKFVLRITNYRSEAEIPRPLRDELRIMLAFLAAWLGFILIAQIQFIRTTQGADQGRYLFPAISVIALFLVLGLTQLRPFGGSAGADTAQGKITNCELRITNWLIASSFLLALFVPFAYTLPAYARPALASEADLARASRPLNLNFANQIELRGYDLSAQFVKPGETLSVTLYWRALAPMAESYRVFVHLVGSNDTSAGGADVIPARGAFPTLYWRPGDALRDVVSIPIAANAAPGKYSVEIGLYPVGALGERLIVEGGGEDRVIVDAIKVAPSQFAAYTPQTRADATFGKWAKLIGYDVSQSSRLTLYWQTIAPFDRDYSVFVHVLDAYGKIVWQADQEPQGGNSPTSLWIVGEQIRDEYRLPQNLAGPNRVRVGMYRPDTGERVPVASGDYYEFAWPGALP